MRLIIRILLTALVFAFIFPKIGGLEFHGQFWPDAVIAGGIFALVAYAIGWIISAATTAFAIGTLGVGLLIIIPAFLFGFWLIPALQLQAMAHFFPEYLTISGWGPAILGGLLLLVVNMVTASPSKKSSSDSSSSEK